MVSSDMKCLCVNQDALDSLVASCAAQLTVEQNDLFVRLKM